MANTTNVAIISTANTFDHWRIRDNLQANDVNEIARGNFIKEKGNITVNEGTLTLANTSGGILLDVKDDARIDGLLSVDTIESDQDGHVYLAAGDITMGNRAAGGLFQANINVVFDSANVVFSNSNIHYTSADANAVILIKPNTTFQTNANVLGILNVASNISNVGNLLVTQNSFTGNLSVTELANVTTGNIVTANVITLNVNASGAAANIANANIANIASANAVIVDATVTTANITTVNATTFITVAGLNVTDQANAARLQANTAYDEANAAANTVATFANGTLVLDSANLNFNNTATVNVGITANGLTQTNVALTVNANSITQFGTLTGLNVSGIANVTTVRSNDIKIDSNSTYAILNGNGTFNNLDVKGNLVILGSSTNDTDTILLRAAAASDGDGFFRVKRGSTGKGNAEIKFLAASDVWQATANANGSPTHYTLLTTQNVTDSVVSTSTVNAAAPNSVKTSYDQASNARDQANTARSTANDAYGQANTARDQANTARDQANTARTVANAAYGQANTARNTANDAYGQANSGYNQANTARTVANAAYGQANTARNTANDAYGQANTATTNAGTAQTTAQNAYGQANTARDQANTARTTANAAYGQANTATTNAGTAQTTAQNAYGQANTARTQANTAYGQANNAYAAANNAGAAGTSSGGSTTLSAGQTYVVTSNGATITLPASPATGALVRIAVSNFTNTTVARNSTNIMGLAENLTIDSANVGITLIYAGTTPGWRIF